MENFNDKNPMKITFSRGDTPIEKPAPLRLVVIADFAGENAQSPRPVRIDTHSFDEVFAQIRPVCHLHVPELTGEQQPLAVQLDHFAQFQPKHFANHIAAFKPFLEVKQALEQVAQRKQDMSWFQQQTSVYRQHHVLGQWLQNKGAQSTTEEKNQPVTKPSEPAAPQPASQHQDTGGLDSLFDLVSTSQPETQARQSGDHVDHFVSSVTNEFGKTAPQNIKPMLEDINTTLNRLMDNVIHQSQWQALEATWRGLKLLLAHCDVQEPLEVEILPVKRDELISALKQLQTRELHEVERPVSCLMVGFSFHRHDADMETLQSLAEIAEEIQAPLIASMSSQFFGDANVTDMRQPSLVLQQTGYEKWNALREKDCAYWLALGFNRVLLREPYDIQSASLRYQETWHHPNDPLWGQPAWILAALIARSQSQTQWPTEISGFRHLVANMPLTPQTSVPGVPSYSPLEKWLPPPVAEDLGGAGLISLVHQNNRDGVFVLGAPMVHKAPHYSDSRQTADHRYLASLAYHLLLNRIVGAVHKFKAKHHLTHADEAKSQWEHYLKGIMAGTGPGHSVQVEVQTDEEGALQLLLALHTGRDVLNGVPLELGIPL